VVIVLLSESLINSPLVRREVTLAINRDRPVLPGDASGKPGLVATTRTTGATGCVSRMCCPMGATSAKRRNQSVVLRHLCETSRSSDPLAVHARQSTRQRRQPNRALTASPDDSAGVLGVTGAMLSQYFHAGRRVVA